MSPEPTLQERSEDIVTRLAALSPTLDAVDIHDLTVKLARIDLVSTALRDVDFEIDELPTTWRAWQCLDAEEKGAVLDVYWTIVRRLREAVDV